MKRKITCMLMALMLVITLLPLGAIRTSAASALPLSENAIIFVKAFEGFSANAYPDGNRYSVGYGTAGYAGQTITMEEAELALREELKTINEKVNQFAAYNNLFLSQYQQDALVSFSFNCGTEWMTKGGRFFDAVTKNASVDAFLFAISLWGNRGSTPDANLINRRICEANLYLNSFYSTGVPAAYTYVIFDPNGGTPGSNGEDKMQAYQASANVPILAANPTKSGYTFAGWYTAPTGGTQVTSLSASTSRATLYAQYTLGGTQLPDTSNTNQGTVLTTGTVVCSTGVNVRSGAGTQYPVVGSAYNGQRISVYEIVAANGMNWGRIGTGRWISLYYAKLDNAPSNNTNNSTTNNGTVNWGGTNTNTPTTYTLGTVTASKLNVRSGAGVNYPGVGSLSKGQQIKIYSQTTVNNAPWGQTDGGWVCLNYVQLNLVNNNTNNNTNTSGIIATGVVNSKTALNVRAGAGTAAPRVGSLSAGTPVSIYEKMVVNGMEWGRIGTNQWVCLAYVTLNASSNTGNNSGIIWNGSGSTTTNPGTNVTTGNGIVTSTTTLSVRSGAGTNFARVDSLKPGTVVNILEVVTVGNQQWGRIGTNRWVCMTYVAMNGNTTNNNTNNNGTTNNGNNTLTIPSSGLLAKVVTNSPLNVRAAAGTNNPSVAKLNNGSIITIYELTYVNGVAWGRTTNGWVCMNYVQLSNTAAGGNVNWH